MRKPSRRKTETVDEYLRRACRTLYGKGLNIIEIARKLNIGNTDVFNYLHDDIKYLTKKECDILKEEYNKGATLDKLSKKYGISKNAIRNKVRSEFKNKYDDFINGSMLDDSVIELIINLYTNESKSINYLSDKFGVGKHVIINRLKKAGVYNPRPTRRVTDEEIDHFNKLYKEKYSISEIARMCNRTRQLVRRYLRK